MRLSTNIHRIGRLTEHIAMSQSFASNTSIATMGAQAADPLRDLAAVASMAGAVDI